MRGPRKLGVFTAMLILCGVAVLSAAERDPGDVAELSAETQACLGCHGTYTPGIVEDWRASRHSRTSPALGMSKPELQRRISAKDVPDELRDYAVGCYECHSRNTDRHRDSFDHMGFRINVIVTPNDCMTCHPVEVSQYSDSKKAHAVKNLMGNPVYHTLVQSVNSQARWDDGRFSFRDPSESTLHETCLGCHGTKLEVEGVKTVISEMGEIVVPNIKNWPNQGVGRENPDGSIGSCAACHPRHGFSIEVARKPYTCAQCHLEPDVPGWNVYKESKHGNIYASLDKHWNFSDVPWTLGRDFTAPTCATCHNSLVVSPDGSVIAERTHDFGARLWVRIFGLIYSHAQPKSGDTTVIVNKDRLPLPTTFTGEPAEEFLIGPEEQIRRTRVMKNICRGCHSSDWTDGHFVKFEQTIRETDQMVRVATDLMLNVWREGAEDQANPFDESIEKLWIQQWLFYANSVRYASAMTGAPDYAAFKNGWWDLSRNLQLMRDHLHFKTLRTEEDNE